MGILPFWVFTHHAVGIAITVRFLIGLVHHIDAPAVAELIEVFAVGIVRGTQEVDVSLLHQRDVFFVGGVIDIATCYGMVVVAVHTTQFHVFAVNLEDLAHTLHTFHTEMVGEMLIILPVLTTQQLHCIGKEPRLFSRPWVPVTFVVETEFDGCRIACTKFANEMIGYTIRGGNR